MKKNRCFKLTALLLAMIMMISVFPSFALGATQSGGATPGDGALLDCELTSTFVKSAIILDANNKEVGDLSAADPNGSFTLNLKVQEPDFPSSDEEKLSPDTKDIPMFYQLENMTAVSGENKVVSWRYDANDGVVYFDWKSGKQTSFEANIQIAPNYDETLGLDGKSFAIVAYNNVLLSGVKSATALKAAAISFDSEGKIWYENPEDAYWTFTQYSGDWYTISRNGQYLHIASGLSLTGAESAQKIKVEARDGYYLLRVNDRSLSCVKANDGFITAGVGTTIADKQKVKLYSEISNESTSGLPENGDYIIANVKKDSSDPNIVYHNMLVDRLGLTSTNTYHHSLAAIQFSLEGDTVIPHNEYKFWHFEHLARDWYYVSNGSGKYLKILSDGPILTEEKVPVLIKRDGSENKYSFTSEGVTNTWLNNKKDNCEHGFYITTNASYKWLQLYSKVKVPETVIPDGEWIITNPQNNTLMQANQKGQISSVAYQKIDGTTNQITVPEGITATYWTFEKIEGNYYYIKCNGRYLNIAKSIAKLTDSPQALYIQQQGDLYRINDGTIFELSGSFKGNYEHKRNFTWLTLSKEHEENTQENALVFNLNGGSGASAPDLGVVQPGDIVTLPSVAATKNGQEFIGWCELSDAFKTVKGDNGTTHTYHDIYTAGSTYTVKNEKTTLYAVYNTTKKNVRFGIRIDGKIQDEPNGFPADKYTGHFWIENDLKIGKWIVDINSTKPVDGYTLQNDVTANLYNLPTADQINEALRTDPVKTDLTFDPETQYIHWYVFKYTTGNGGEWHVDGVIRNKGKVGVSYNFNVPSDEKAQIKNMPGSQQVVVGSEILIGTNASSTEVLRPTREGYVFNGWNTEPDGTGTSYAEGHYVKLTSNLNLYAQWVKADEEDMVIYITSDWPAGKPAYAGTPITLTANLTGFEGKTYTLQWQYTVDQENWVDVPGANDINFTYAINAENAAYTWRVVANDVH